ncbi:UNVERIFIED_ORG: NAD(P)-dependent dehydrogenase (short-subunit alcohol dehydrogenase family) [Nocardia globerula]|uniref:NAD(P)-dependent dehydrogenase (Short-subunit alcohol dehydrogenase family) n=1 Tax=Nocardia globerula TaxID=1818 RepID=A0A652YQA4_NOCGL|nr:glucose 1-dehydrogenase [Rhodococcus globerulus]NMD63654.1 glucose 1-dehydrogenase [Nocardia globerula]PVX63219.1 NAD(P)-dependent dehydrogenase (short-subunit alcohol dehydrogenase family) [Rhodococcus globerulus]
MGDRFIGRVAVVTGGASGIGEAAVRELHAEGASVVIADIQVAPGQLLAAELGNKAIFLEADVSAESDVAAAVDAAVSRFGQLDIMFNNAGVMGTLGPIDSTCIDDADRTIAINLRSVISGMKHAARVMKPRRCGVIISTSSPAGMLGGVGPHVYSATKAAVIGISNSVAAELRPFNIRVNTVVPGAVVSPMTASLVAGGPDHLDQALETMNDTALMSRPLLPADVAAAVLYLASDAAAFVTGVTLPVDAGMTGAIGQSPFATGKYDQSVTVFEAGRRT